MDILIAKNLSKTYGKGEVKVDALKEVSFSVAKGEFISIVGPSGSGKSTLLNLLGALDSPTSGNVLLDGKDISTMKEKNLSVFRRRNIGFIFQAFNLIPELNVEENILLPLLLDYKKPDMQYIGELLDILGLSSRKHHLPNQLSGGQQQRVAIGRALSTRPAIMLADEPTGNLDTKNSKEVINLLKLSVKRYNQTLIMITHNSSFASFSDRVLNVEDGIVSELGRVKK
ncbi:ABC transporter ATP-binding protein [Clostridium estertheticum]|uniref:Peptide ABC transporter ATP-binding protein n=1 Tax=Clostridium estertheticum subsp. estertheticum TaxID=1552 RepID=A0A1J0GD19_9CLOT|nr:ABC transporter ATP-binding protein [Clostridium estertheticum]APC39239.1 peptide ABC transporter ATP-binding protein [Clostridium estertheticum subsp. estertheticum]MBZ9614768.1 ABC transporter ATP-binding protein [Clostridium estertheticum subsp. laramiense]WAG74685.1 ABC transporter ATP-binding protein [Clostridium estertheticum]